MLIKLLSANFINDTSFLSKMDPFVEIRVGKYIARSKIDVDGGKTPRWNEKFALRIKEAETIKLKACDSNRGKNELIGETTIDFFPYESKELECKIIYYKEDGKVFTLKNNINF